MQPLLSCHAVRANITKTYCTCFAYGSEMLAALVSASPDSLFKSSLDLLLQQVEIITLGTHARWSRSRISQEWHWKQSHPLNVQWFINCFCIPGNMHKSGPKKHKNGKKMQNDAKKCKKMPKKCKQMQKRPFLCGVLGLGWLKFQLSPCFADRHPSEGAHRRPRRKLCSNEKNSRPKKVLYIYIYIFFHNIYIYIFFDLCWFQEETSLPIQDSQANKRTNQQAKSTPVLPRVHVVATQAKQAAAVKSQHLENQWLSQKVLRISQDFFSKKKLKNLCMDKPKNLKPKRFRSAQNDWSRLCLKILLRPKDLERRASANPGTAAWDKASADRSFCWHKIPSPLQLRYHLKDHAIRAKAEPKWLNFHKAMQCYAIYIPGTCKARDALNKFFRPRCLVFNKCDAVLVVRGNIPLRLGIWQKTSEPAETKNTQNTPNDPMPKRPLVAVRRRWAARSLPLSSELTWFSSS